MDASSATSDVWSIDDTDSPYTHLLHTNRAPSPVELQGIRAYLPEPKAKLERLDAEIRRMRAIVEGLESQRAQLREFVESHKALLSPIKRSPPELLQELFVRCLPTGRRCVLAAWDAPLVLTQICSEWRNIVLSTPELWSSLHISIPRRGLDPNSTIPLFLQQAQGWLARSGTCSLSISLYIGDPHEDVFPSIADLVAPYMHRIRSLELTVPANFLTRIESLKLPNLKEIIVRLGDSTSVPSGPSVFWKQMPCIRRLNLAGNMNLDSTRFLPLSQLLEIRLECDYTLIEILDVLKQCGNLQDAFLSPQSFEPFTELDHPITLPHLRTLSIKAEATKIQALLRTLTVPRLQELRVAIPSSWDEFPSDHRLYPALSALIARSSCGLKSFCVPYIDTSHYLEDCFSLMPELTTLELGSVGWDAQNRGPREPLLEQLIPTTDASSTSLLPNLRCLQLLNHRGLSNRVLLDFIHSRRQSAPPGIAQLAQVFIRRWDTTSGEDDIYPDIRALREDGLNISVITERESGAEHPFTPTYYNAMEGLPPTPLDLFHELQL